MQIVRPRLRGFNLDWRRIAALVMALLAVAIGVLAWIGYTYAARTEPLVVAAEPIAPGTRITKDMLTVIQAPLTRPDQLRGLRDTRIVSGTYALVQISPDQIIQPDNIQATPLDQHIYGSPDGAPEVLQGTVFELSLRGVSTVTTEDRINIVALIDPKRGIDPSFSIGQMDVAGSGPRAIRVMRNLNVLEVTKDAVLIEVSDMQSHYLWALAASEVPFVGEITTEAEAPLGPLRPQDIDQSLLQDGVSSSSSPLPSIVPPIPTAAPATGAPASEATSEPARSTVPAATATPAP